MIDVDMSDPQALRSELLRFLEGDGFTFTAIESTESLEVGSDIENHFRDTPVFDLPADLLREYLELQGRRYYAHYPDPMAEALSMTQIHAMGALGSVSGDCGNLVRRLGFRRTEDGDVEFFVEKGPTPPPPDYGEGEFGWFADPPTG
ncbi:hypothetical protein ACFQE5_12625 [Pseudonocardia hispaniensis]|uniref:SUKH-3 immunity protein of toxin-antitoxin system n=1 Tax=Pseudonocardia hispaniensis TaxID=904933 RepID=A0ABW1J2Y5_9PSEU